MFFLLRNGFFCFGNQGDDNVAKEPVNMAVMNVYRTAKTLTYRISSLGRMPSYR